MAYSTPTPRTRYTPKSGAQADFRPMGLKSAGVGTNAPDAANTVSTSSIYGTLRDNAPNSADIAVTAAANRMKERVSAEAAEARMAMAGIDGAAAVEKATQTAAMIDKQTAATKKGGMATALGGIASAAFGLIGSDETTKHSIVELDDALETLRKLRPVSYYYKPEFTDDPERAHNGFIAQEYQELLPDATYKDPMTGKLCIDTRELIALNVRAIQQLLARVEELESHLPHCNCVK